MKVTWSNINEGKGECSSFVQERGVLLGSAMTGTHAVRSDFSDSSVYSFFTFILT